MRMKKPWKRRRKNPYKKKHFEVMKNLDIADEIEKLDPLTKEDVAAIAPPLLTPKLPYGGSRLFDSIK